MMVMLYTNLLTGPPMTWSLLVVFWYLVPFATYLLLASAAWVMLDNPTRPMPAPHRVVQSWRRSGFYRLFRDYFPLRTVMASPPAEKGGASAFDPAKNYLFCYHPHGVMSAGAFGFATAATGFDDLFPGLRCSVQTLALNFNLPVTRENLLALGAGDASKRTLPRVLGGGRGSSAMLVTGGARESMPVHPGHTKVVSHSLD